MNQKQIYIYILLENKNELFKLKISLKNVNASFVENKITAQRAYILFGEKWKTIILIVFYFFPELKH